MTTARHAILTAIGADRPGLVEEVSQFIFARGGNIADSRMVNLRGQFAMMLLVSGPDRALDDLARDLPKLEQASALHVELRPASDTQAKAAADALPYRLTATAMDQAGLVHRISHLLRALSVNIESMETTLAAAPITGAPMFEMELIMAVPRKTPLAKLRDDLGKLCDELNIDWQLAAM